MHELTQLLIHGDNTVPLDMAALQIAAIEYPDLEPQLFLELLDSFARELDPMVRRSSGREFVRIANCYLFETSGFQGDRRDYYHPRNSCLNQVLLMRTGIPISLSIVYMEIARRLQRPVVGIGLPGHFLASYRAQDYTCWIDCFRGGRILTFEQCRELALETARVDIRSHPEAMRPVSNREIALRMLNNLANAYLRRGEREKAVGVLDLLITATPGAASARDRRTRGLLHLECGRPRSAMEDLTQYLELAPQAQDRGAVEEQLARIRRLLGSVN